MIETLKEAQDAIEEIQGITGWTLSRVARKADIADPQPARILAGKHDPTEDTLDKLDTLLRRIRRKEG